MTHMTRPTPRRSARRAATAIAVLALVLSAIPAWGGPHRARLSRDLADRLATGTTEATSVIVSGSDADIRAIAARHGARIKKALRGAAVLEVPAGQLASLSDDEAVEHLTGDARVYRTAVTEVATGADQVWSGLDGLQGFTGRGIGVAVIDSGIAPHKALSGPCGGGG